MRMVQTITRRRFISLGAGLAGAAAIYPRDFARAQSQGRLKVDPGEFTPLPIAIPNFVPGTPADGEVGAGVSQVITNNLKRSGLFAPIDPAAFIERITDIDKVPQFQNWKTINAQALVTGRVTRQPDGRLNAAFRLWDVATGQPIAGNQFSTAPENWRRIAHIIVTVAEKKSSAAAGPVAPGAPVAKKKSTKAAAKKTAAKKAPAKKAAKKSAK